MTAHRFSLFTLLVAALFAAPVHAQQQTEGERLLLERRKESLRLTRDAANPAKPLVATEAVIPDVEDLASRFKRTQAKLKPETLAAYKPGPAHDTLRGLGCNVLGSTPMGALTTDNELHMETLVFRCADGAQGRLTTARNVPPDIHVELDLMAVTGTVADHKAVIRYFSTDKSKRLVILQSWMSASDHLMNLEYALPPSTTDVKAGEAWAKAREVAVALDKAYPKR